VSAAALIVYCPAVAACATCGADNPEGNRFCGGCGTPLGAAPSRPVAEERKVVTALFCDLAGFTALSESADPEDVDEMLTRYSSMAQAAIESFGGVVEKFIGDAVVGVFGVPAAHEDDPERAVRAGLRIVEDADQLTAVDGSPLLLRVGINTGEALVRLGVAPGSGERLMAGDAINTASRIQSVAPQMGVAVGQPTFDATRAVFHYKELPPASVKGKTEPVAVFHAVQSRATFGSDLTRTHDLPFVGREIDLALLKGVFAKARAAESVQLVTVVGEPGLGKSRLVDELFGSIDASSDLITWRQGRCLPYGAGITFWALGEILKAHAGILESDPPSVAIGKLDEVLPEGDERAWFRQRLLPLLGIEATSTAERQELFTAWRRFLEHIAEQDPTVVVFEDLHWADEAMLAFIEHLADHAEAVPLLIVGTARPELFEKHPDYTNGLRNATPISLTPLSETETARLVSALLDTTVLQAELQQPILDRAGGNPLYAEEFVRLLQDRDLLTAKGSSWELRTGAEVPFPDSVQALIAARLDTLAPAAKSLLADAAVVGKVFWTGAVATMSGRDAVDVAQVLRELTRKELVRPSRRSAIVGETEYAFWHVLTRDVAYGQLPRAARAARHVAAAEWIESMAGDRVEDHSDVLAYHYATALELARAAGDETQARAWETPALRFLTLAGERALGLDTVAALTSFERALVFTPPGHSDRADSLARFGEAALHTGRYAEAAEALAEAIAAFRRRGDPLAVARALPTLEEVLQARGDAGWADLPAEAVTLLEPLPPSAELVGALTELARAEALQERPQSAIAFAEEALSVADQLGLDRPARALGFRGMARSGLGDAGGLTDYRDAIVLASQAGQGREVALLHNNLGCDIYYFDGPDSALQVWREGIAFAKSRGLTEMVDAIETSSLQALFSAGMFDEAISLADSLTQRLGSLAVFDLIHVRAVTARILAITGEAEQATPWLDWLESTARASVDPQHIVFGLAAAIEARAGLGDTAAAATLLTELEATPESRSPINYADHLPAMVRTALTIGQRPLAERLLTGVGSRWPYETHSLLAATAALAEATGDFTTAATAYADTATRWEHLGVIPEGGFALLGHGRCLIALGNHADARPVLSRARSVFARIGATPALAQIDTLLGDASTRSS
jgi:class 3 adenylate cyclase/tetratricopeptide (TPR) repeat protein